MEKVISIAGGGLAGLSLGIGLRQRGIPVTISESGAYPRHRVCGEFISGVTPSTLRALGIEELFLPARAQTTSAWFVREKFVIRHDLPVPALGISRHCLDEALRQRFESLGGLLHSASRESCVPAEGLVWSTGRRPTKGPWIGLKCHVEGLSMQEDLEMHLGSGAYVGLARVEGNRTNVCGLFRVRREIRSERTLLDYLAASDLSALADRLVAARILEDSFSAVAGFQLGWQKNPAGLFALGDSLAMIPPFTGNGMSMAFESAEIALDPLEAYSQGRTSWDDAVKTTKNHLVRQFGSRLFFAQLLHPFLTSASGQAFFASFARTGLLPFQFCLQLVR